ncbi:hypothetical protein [Velocimicrobium porci]|uniref:Uncharacterized protein n=1 Tax=Velocimicrobium porci TaxID=2606634 RepID=A0A6L5XUZ2_9FIRM|nr:hypothetical protein [Velocimicrobium porci]MSS62419.1 hypothetical protein [Velocimicrobium porci]
MKSNRFIKFALCVAVTTVTVMGIKSELSLAASKIHNLKENKTYKIDLDQDGQKEAVSYKLETNKNDISTYKIIINGKIKTTVKGLYDAYDPHMQITDIDTKDGVMDIWVYSMGSSEDVIFSALYQYKEGKMKKVYSLGYKELGEHFHLTSGILNKADGNGKFYIMVDRAFFVDCLIGNHFDIIPYQLKNGKVSRVKTNTYSIHKIYNRDNQLTVAKKVTFYKEPDKSKGTAFTLKKGEKVRPVSIYYSKEKVFVKFKSTNGKIGWLCANDYGFEDSPAFLDIVLCD